jgi:hypothetical protein
LDTLTLVALAVFLLALAIVTWVISSTAKSTRKDFRQVSASQVEVLQRTNKALDQVGAVLERTSKALESLTSAAQTHNYLFEDIGYRHFKRLADAVETCSEHLENLTPPPTDSTE